MIITRSPLRISLLGGGTDISEFYKRDEAIIFGGSINQHVYVVSNNLSKFSSEKFRFTYRKTESVLDPGQFQHPVVRSVLSKYKEIQSINLTTFSDIPGGTGLGSSSAFTVALLGNLHSLTNKISTSIELAQEAIYIERHELNEAGGIQDQIHSAVGGLRIYKLFKDKIQIGDNLYNSQLTKKLNQSMILVRVGQFRDSKQVHFSKNDKGINFEILRKINDITKHFQIKFWKNESTIQLLTECINESWNLKKKLDPKVSNSEVDDIINLGFKNGAQAAKLCGAGESGFILFIAPPWALIGLTNVFREDKCQKVEFIEHGFENLGLTTDINPERSLL